MPELNSLVKQECVLWSQLEVLWHLPLTLPPNLHSRSMAGLALGSVYCPSTHLGGAYLGPGLTALLLMLSHSWYHSEIIHVTSYLAGALLQMRAQPR